MLKPKTLHIINQQDKTPIKLQASLEYLIAKHLEGKLQAGITISQWQEKSLILGYYQPYRSKTTRKTYRRITGGPEIETTDKTTYLGLVFASENLQEVVDLAYKLANSIKPKRHIIGATRVGPKPLAAGVIELIGEYDPEIALDYVRTELFDQKLEIHHFYPGERLEKLSKPYRDPRWIRYLGVEPYNKKCTLRSGNYILRLGIHILEDKFIGDLTVDGNFQAAPPNEPFNLMNTVTGMPIGDQTIYTFEIRLDKQLEIYGIDKNEIICCLRKLLGLDNE